MTEQLMDDLTNEEHEALLLMSEHGIAAPLSPAAQAVLAATGRKAWYRNNDIAAALRAVVDQLGYDNYNVDGDHGLAVVNVRDILFIADELEALPND